MMMKYLAVTVFLCVLAFTKANYKVTFKTSSQWFSGTDAKVSIALKGTIGQSGAILLATEGHHMERSDEDTYDIPTDFGYIYQVEVWHDNSGWGSGWLIDWVKIIDVQRQVTVWGEVDSWHYGAKIALNFDVTGGWSTWGGVGDCSVTCGEGVKSESRTCTNPPPKNNGANCAGDRVRDVACKVVDCPIDGQWGKFGEWQPCGATCGLNWQIRSRECNNPAPGNGGQFCKGYQNQRRSCEVAPCPADMNVDGGWGDWTGYGACSATCGTGTQSKTRACDHPAPQNDGADCKGYKQRNRSCPNLPAC